MAHYGIGPPRLDHMPLWFNSLKSIRHRKNMEVPIERSRQALSVGSYFVVVRVVIAELQSCNGIWSAGKGLIP